MGMEIVIHSFLAISLVLLLIKILFPWFDRLQSSDKYHYNDSGEKVYDDLHDRR